MTAKNKKTPPADKATLDAMMALGMDRETATRAAELLAAFRELPVELQALHVQVMKAQLRAIFPGGAR